ncbi:hypothetical protein CALCODRAFT_155668 [Calocera cornea HHB12733]|uniref:Uncharacterized protein n=1 Tax=Calocera cornea HHB12733 TaxID=1353952 RepID=A0A165HZ07_9BASI|nr:hypothetical protein CALCODRAFT_155668 [Calocera cornea HHB12733]
MRFARIAWQIVATNTTWTNPDSHRTHHGDFRRASKNKRRSDRRWRCRVSLCNLEWSRSGRRPRRCPRVANAAMGSDNGRRSRSLLGHFCRGERCRDEPLSM